MLSPCFTPLSFGMFWVSPMRLTRRFVHPFTFSGAKTLRLHLVPLFKNVEAVANHRRDATAAVFQVILSWLERGHACRCCRGMSWCGWRQSEWDRVKAENKSTFLWKEPAFGHCVCNAESCIVYIRILCSIYVSTPSLSLSLSLSLFVCPLLCAWLYRPGLCPGPECSGYSHEPAGFLIISNQRVRSATRFRLILEKMLKDILCST